LPSELIGAFLWAQLENAAAINAKRTKLCSAYRAGLAELARAGKLDLPKPEPEGVRGNGHLFYVLLKDLETRARLIAHLKSRGVHSVFHYVPLHSSPGGKRYGRTAGPLPVTDDIANRLLRLPLFYGLEEEQAAAITTEIAAFLK
jgi:dTDP-4-amino-4,6-dideoxygalactose transaminase